MSDERAVTLASQAQLAISGGEPVSDVLLNADATWIAGGTKESGTATLTAKGTVKARLDFTGQKIRRSEIRNDASGPDGEWAGADGNRHRFALHNCWTPAGWFAPSVFVHMLSAPDVAVRYLGPEVHNGAILDHLAIHRTSIEQNPVLAHDLEKFSTIDVFLDSSTHLPIALSFNTHPDDDNGRDIPVEIRFSEYRTVNGVAVPFHIRRLLQGVLNLDLTVTSATINAGMPESEFVLQSGKEN